MYDISAFARPATLPQALEALAQDPAQVVIAGGTDVLIKVREGRLAGCRLLSIHALPELQKLFADQTGMLHIGPLATFDQLEHHPLTREKLPVLAEGAAQAGGPQLRAQGTVGGNLCNGATSADTAPALLCLDAILVLSTAHGSRQLPLRQFHTGPGKVALEPGELLTDILIPPGSYLQHQGCYLKYSMRRAMDIATIGCGVQLQVRQNALVDLRIALGVAAPTPIRLPQAEKALLGYGLAQAQEKIAALVRQEITPRDSWRASKEFRLQIAGELAKRALTQAWQRGEGGTAQ